MTLFHTHFFPIRQHMVISKICKRRKLQILFQVHNYATCKLNFHLFWVCISHYRSPPTFPQSQAAIMYYFRRIYVSIFSCLRAPICLFLKSIQGSRLVSLYHHSFSSPNPFSVNTASPRLDIKSFVI